MFNVQKNSGVLVEEHKKAYAATAITEMQLDDRK